MQISNKKKTNREKKKTVSKKSEQSEEKIALAINEKQVFYFLNCTIKEIICRHD